jgi:hypothetical protein
VTSRCQLGVEIYSIEICQAVLDAGVTEQAFLLSATDEVLLAS